MLHEAAAYNYSFPEEFSHLVLSLVLDKIGGKCKSCL